MGMRPNREELLRTYFRIKQARDHIRQDVNDVHIIVQNLNELYLVSRDDCCWWRYSNYKNMVITTVANYNRMCELRQARMGLLRDGTQAQGSSSGAFTRLKENALAIARIQQEGAQWKELNEDMEKEHTSEITRQSEEALAEVQRLECEFSKLCRLLDRLSDKFNWAASLCFCWRYTAYRDMVREIFIEDAITAQPTTALI